MAFTTNIWRYRFGQICLILYIVLMTIQLTTVHHKDVILKPNNELSIPTVIVAACMNRISTLNVAINSWLTTSGVSEIILVDWSSNPSILESLSDLSEDSRIKIVTVQGEKKWILSWAYNLASKFLPSDSLMLKVDCDTVLAPDFIQHHPLTKDYFYAGNWRLAKTENAKYLNGIFYTASSNFFTVHGFDERIQTYGYEDTDLYIRLNTSGLQFVPIDSNKVYHLDHAPNLRFANQFINDAVLENEKNRIRRGFLLAWNKTNSRVSFHIEKKINTPRHYVVTRTSSIPPIESLIQKDARDYVERLAAQTVLRKYNVPSKNLNVSTDYMINMIPSYKNGRMLIVHVQHGLGSRLIAMASGMAISEKTGRHFRLIWELDEHCKIPFQELFFNKIDVWDEFQPNEISAANFDRYNYVEAEIIDINGKLIKTDTLNHIYVKTAYKLNHPEVKPKNMHKVLSKLRLQPYIAAKLNELNITKFIGVHIRTADPKRKIPGIQEDTFCNGDWRRVENWPKTTTISIFQLEINRILDKSPLQQFFLSTDSEDVKKNVKKLFKNRIISLDREACNDRSQKCLIFAAADLWILSRSSQILGSPYSSFSEVAGLLGNITTKYAGIDFPHVESDHQTRRELSGKGNGVIYMDFGSHPDRQHYDIITSVKSLHKVHKNTIPVAIFIDDDTRLDQSKKRLFKYIYQINNSQTTQDEYKQTTLTPTETQQKSIVHTSLRKIQQFANSPFEVTLYLNGDTWLCNKLSNLSQILQNHDILFSKSVHHKSKSKSKSSWNSNVILYRNSPVVIQFFRLWEKLYLEECISSQIKDSDDSALNSALKLSTTLHYSSLDTTYSVHLGSETQVNVDSEPEKFRTQLIRWPVKIIHLSKMISNQLDDLCDVVNEQPFTPRIIGITSSKQLTVYYTKAECDKETKNNCNTQTF